MMKKMVLLLLCLCWIPLGVAQAAAPKVPTANSIYRQALDAYLDGNLDQAISLVAKSLTQDPDNLKSKNLLSILVFEKEKREKERHLAGG